MKCLSTAALSPCIDAHVEHCQCVCINIAFLASASAPEADGAVRAVTAISR